MAVFCTSDKYNWICQEFFYFHLFDLCTLIQIRMYFGLIWFTFLGWHFMRNGTIHFSHVQSCKSLAVNCICQGQVQQFNLIGFISVIFLISNFLAFDQIGFITSTLQKRNILIELFIHTLIRLDIVQFNQSLDSNWNKLARFSNFWTRFLSSSSALRIHLYVTSSSSHSQYFFLRIPGVIPEFSTMELLKIGNFSLAIFF